MNIDDLVTMWSKDSIIDDTQLAEESIKTGRLHSKYLSIRFKHKLMAEKLRTKYLEEKNWFQSYYAGEYNMESEELNKRELKPFQGPHTQAKINGFVDSNKYLNTILTKQVLNKEIVEFCDLVLNELKQRTFEIKNYIDWRRFESGT